MNDLERINDENHRLKEFYLRKYHEMYVEIIENRFKEIEAQSLVLEEEIAMLTKTKEQMGTEIDFNNQQKKCAEELAATISSKYSEIEAMRYENEKKRQDLKEQSLNNYQKYAKHIQEWFDRIALYKNKVIDGEQLIYALDELTRFIENEGYQINSVLKANQQQLTQNELDENLKTSSIKASIIDLKDELLQIELKINSVNEEKLNQIKRDLATQIEHKNKYRLELHELFEKTKKNHERLISDEATKMGFLEIPIKERVPRFEEQLVNLRKELLGLETVSKLKYQKSRRLNTLYHEKERLEKIEQQREKCEADLMYAQTIYSKAQKNYQVIRDYITIIHEKIVQENRYNDYINKLNVINERLKEAESSLEHLKAERKKLEDRRYMTVYNTQVGESLNLIDEKLEKVNTQITVNTLEFDSATLAVTNLKEDGYYLQIVKYMNEMEYYQKHLPKFEEKMDLLRNSIKEKSEELKTCQEGLKGYQTILMQIEELENENRHK